MKEDGSIITEEDDIFVDDPDTLVSFTTTYFKLLNSVFAGGVVIVICRLENTLIT